MSPSFLGMLQSLLPLPVPLALPSSNALYQGCSHTLLRPLFFLRRTK
jgi:hypothetical protein